jgi:microcystin-dependent protein
MANPVNPRFIQAQSFQLSAAGATAGSTSITLQSFLYSDGVTQIVTADLGDWCYMTLEPNNGTQEEAIQFTGVTQNANGTATLTGVSSVGFKYPYTLTSGLVLNHAGGVTCIISNDAAMYGNLVAYMNSTLASGLSPVASTTVKGVVQIPTAAQINSSLATGSTGAPLAITPDQLALSNYGLDLNLSGMVSMYGGASAPTGWLLCDGTAYSRSTYATLFGIISTSYGSGDGSTTFNVPDLRSSMALGAGTKAKTFTFSSLSNPTITVTGSTNSSSNEIQTGTAITFHANSGSITGLTDNTVYYIIRVAYNQFSLATTLANAQNGTTISLTGSSGSPLFTITLTARSVGDTGGNETHAMSATELLAHTHVEILGSITSGGSLLGTANSSIASNPISASSVTASTGGNAAMPIMNPFTVISYIIKT